jgi:hypothetical protein
LFTGFTFLRLAVTLLIGTQAGMSQPAILNYAITAEYDNVPLGRVLEDLSSKTGIKFSFSPKKIPENTLINASFSNVPFTQVLDRLFRELPIRYEFLDDYVILKSKDEVPINQEAEEAKKFTINGYIRDNKTGEFLIGATIYIRELEVGTISNNYGYFSLTIPPGKYTLFLSYMGYEAKEQTIELVSNMKFDFNMVPTLQLMEEVVITSFDNEKLLFKKVASQSEILPESVKKQPALLGESDVLKSLELQPGITFYSDGSSYFHVRGGYYDQNLILLDEATIYNPSHLLGIFSPIIPDAVNSVDIYKAGFPVNYGGRLSSVIDIRTRDGSMSKYRFSGSAGLISARATIEGPIVKDRSSFFISLRRSYFDNFIKPLAPQLGALYFYDLTSKTNFRIGPRNRFFITFYKGEDVFRVKEKNEQLNGLDWGNTSATFRWNHIFGSRLFLNSTVYGSKYNYYLRNNVSEHRYWHSQIANSTLKEELTFYTSPSLTWRFGAQYAFYRFNPGNYYDPDNIENIQVSPVHSFETVYYAGADHEVFPWLAMRYGLRAVNWSDYGKSFVVRYDDEHDMVGIDYYEKDEQFFSRSTLEPRLSVSVKKSSNVFIKAGYSRTSQHINLISNSISPFNSFEVWLPAGPNIKPQYADIVDIGYLQGFSNSGYTLETDLFYKWMHNQVGYEYHANMLMNPLVEGEIRQGEGWAYGFEASVKKEGKRVQGQISYTFSRSFLEIDEINNGSVFPATQDRPHVLNMSFAFQARPRWLITGDLNFASGAPVTTPTSFYYYRGYQVPLFTNKNNDRLPPYKRVDLATTIQLNKTPERYDHSLTFAIYNIFAQENPIFLYFNKTLDDDGTLVVPSDRLNLDEITPSIRYTFIFLPSITYQFRF